MKPGIHISDPAGEWDGKDDGDDRSPAEMAADIRAETDKARARRDVNARKPRTIGDLDPAKIYARFNNPPKGATLADADKGND